MSKQESSNVDQLHEVLSTCLNPIMARGLIRSALSQVGMTEEELQRSGLTPSLKDALERGLKLFCRQDPDRRSKTVTKLAFMLAKQDKISNRKDQAPSDSDSVSIRIKSEIDIVRARNEVRSLARDIGFNTTDETKIATAVSELSRNIFNYAGEGTVNVTSISNGKKGLRIRAVDEGPGIADIDKVLSGSYQSKTGLGLGLRGCKRLMDQFDIKTGASTGTCVTMEKHV